ncbi:pseudouridine synthase, partial [Marinovum algicola]|uniref:pseudouridine synthase n=1 Tax=Marinovum algicola TaxID=42444 RepID=UPI0024B9EDFD
MSGVQKQIVGEADGGQRIDRWLRRMFPHLSQGRIEKMCRKGELRVDGGRVKSATRIEAGQEVRIPPIPDAELTKPAPKRDIVSEADAEMIRACVIWKDDHIIALNKPPGLPTQGGSKQIRHVDGLAEALRFGYDEKPRLVHRLDKDTSGLNVFVRRKALVQTWTELLKRGQKEYLVMCHGTLASTLVVDAPTDW